jgi:hypothetical protein
VKNLTVEPTFTTKDDWHSGTGRLLESQNTRLLNRREINGLCIGLGLSLPAAGAMFALSSRASALDAITDAASNGPGRRVKFPDGTVVPALGQGSWHLGEGMTLIDTAEVYSGGHSEELIGRAIVVSAIAYS